MDCNRYVQGYPVLQNFLVALNITRSGTNKPRLVAWSQSSDIGALPTTWTSSSTNDAGEVDLAEAYSPIVDGLPLRDSFIIYTQDSTHRMDYVGGDSVMRFQKIMGMSGLLTTNCAVEFDGWHFAVTGSDVIIHDGYRPIPYWITRLAVISFKASTSTIFQNVRI